MQSLKVYGIILLLVFTGCSKFSDKKDKQGDGLISKAVNNITATKVIDSSLLIIRIPGKDSVNLPEKTITPVPSKQKFSGIKKVIPGKSNLHIDESNSSSENIKSELPEIVQFNNKDFSNGQFEELKIVKQVKIFPTVKINKDSVTNVYKYLLDKKLFTSDNGLDTVFPPISIVLPHPHSYKALPFNYKENALFDISVLETTQELPNPFIRSIATDENNVLWFCTHTGGLISFDGEYFIQYDDPRRLTSQPSLSMIIDSQGRIWTGTKGGGAFCYDGIYSSQYTVKQGLISNDITDIIEDSEGNIWFASPDGVSKLAGNQIISFNKSSGLAHDYVFTIFNDKEGNIWFGTMGGGVSKFDGSKFTTISEDDGLCGNRILSINQDNKGNYWFGSYGNGISKFDGKQFTNFNLQQGLVNNSILDITIDADNNIWFGTYGNGILMYDGEGFYNYNTNHGLSYDYIRSLFYDDHGNIWIGTDGSGVSKINTHSFVHYTDNQGLKNENVTAIYEDNNSSIILSPFEEGIFVFDKVSEPGALESYIQINKNNGFKRNIVLAIDQDNNNNYWIGTFGGGASMIDYEKYKKGELCITSYDMQSGLNSNVVRCIFTDSKGNQWFATEGGATIFDGDRFVTLTKKTGLNDNNVLTVFEDRSGNIWLGTMDGGVSCLKNDTIVNYSTENGLPNNTVWNIMQDSLDNLWFGTNGGLVGFNGKVFKTINKENGLSSNNIFSLIKDNNDIFWAGTIKGLNQVKIEFDRFFESNNAKKPYDLNIFDQMDGLIGLDFTVHSVLLDNTNCLWWGTDKVLTMLDLNNYEKYNFTPNPRVTKLLIGGKDINFVDLKMKNQFETSDKIEFNDVNEFTYIPLGLSLPYDLNHITFEYSATDWKSSDQILFQYMINGFDKNWSVPVKTTSVDYRNIEPGSYVFKLRTKGRSGDWSEVYEFPFEIRQAWYLGWLSLLAYVVTFAFLVWLIIRWRVSIVQRQKRVLEKMVSRRTKELNKALGLAEAAALAKNQFIATISHELRTPLNAILGLTNLAIKNNHDSKIDDYLYKVESSSITLLGLINEILDFSKIEAGKMRIENIEFDLQSVLTSVIELNSPLAQQKNLELIINVDKQVPDNLIGDPLRLGQIITNLCNNAIKFTDSGEIIVEIKVEEFISSKELFLEVTVSDTGIGIPDHLHSQLFEKFNQADASITRKYGGTGLGLSICKLLIEMMDGQIWLKSEVGKGSSFSFDFKAGIQINQDNTFSDLPEDVKRFHVVICSSNSRICESVTNICESVMLGISVAKNPDALSDLLVNNKDVILIFEPIVDGVNIMSLVNDLKTKNSEYDIKTIILASDISESRNLMISKVNFVLIKPVSKKSLLNTIASLFSERRIKTESSTINIESDYRLKKILEGKRVLLADDNNLNQQIVIELLSSVGIIIDCVKNGKQAVEKLKMDKYELILMDIHMPVMDGFTATTIIRDMKIQTPIIAITADVMESIKNKCEEVGINDIINKPINTNYLFTRLVFWLTNNNPEAYGTDLQLEKTDSIEINIDYENGIRRLAGDEALYIKMFKKFADSLENTIRDISQLIEAHSYKLAYLSAHNLKGESGNLGANNVYKLATKIEQQIKDRNFNDTDNTIDELYKSTSEVIEFPDYFLKHFSKVDQGQVIRPVHEIAKEMVDAINKHDPNIFNLVDELEKSSIDLNDLLLIKQAIGSNKTELAKNKLNKLFE